MASVQQPNPYAPPQVSGVVSERSRNQSGSITGLSLVLVVVWGVFSAVVCFVGRYVPGVNGDLFGFGGMGLCTVGLPVITALVIRTSRGHLSLRACSLLDLLGLFVFVAAVRMQATASFRPHHWLVFVAMAGVMLVISMLLGFLHTRYRSGRVT